MAADLDFQRVQKEFCAHLRDPRRNPAPEGIEDRRMGVYRDLFFKNILGLVERAFPRVAKLLGEERRRELCYAFYSRHGCRTPYFHRIGQEFVDYLRQEHDAAPEVPPFLAELADYEWVSVRLRVSEGPPPTAPAEDCDLLDQPLALSPHCELCVYAWPVHRINSDFQPEQKPDTPTFLFAFRARNGRTRFLELNPVTARLIALLKDQPAISARSQLDRIAAELGRDSPASVLEGGQAILARLLELGAISGNADNLP